MSAGSVDGSRLKYGGRRVGGVERAQRDANGERTPGLRLGAGDAGIKFLIDDGVEMELVS